MAQRKKSSKRSGLVSGPIVRAGRTDTPFLRTRGLRFWREALIDELFGERKRAELRFRRAVEDIVDVFLNDRKSFPHMFVLAHRIGRHLRENYKEGCRYDYDDKKNTFTLDCGIGALHSRMGTSVAWSWESDCSICGAGDFKCFHQPGQSYEGTTCSRVNRRNLVVDHMAITPNPDFPYTYRLQSERPRSEIEKELGRSIKMERGEYLSCDHCVECYGFRGPKDEDLDRSLWDVDNEPD